MSALRRTLAALVISVFGLSCSDQSTSPVIDGPQQIPDVLFSQLFTEQTVIDFDDLGEGPLPADQFRSDGVIFSSGAGGNAWVWSRSGVPSVLDDPNGGTFSVPSAVAGRSWPNVSVVATFVLPGTDVPATTTFVQVGACSGPGPDLLGSNVALLGFDADGNLIASDPANTSLQFDILSISAPQIARVEMIASPILEIFDDFMFAAVGNVTIDIKPGSDPNCVNPNSRGRIAVAIVTTDVFDPAEVDVSTVTVGGVAPIRWSSNKDVSGDGLADLVFHFRTQDLNDAGLLSDGNTLTLSGALLDGTPIQGSDVVHLAGGPNCF